jgi:hypothetical protein
MPKIALSASLWVAPAVKAMLSECEVIYTTNVDARQQLEEQFGREGIKFIPYSTQQMMDFLKSQHPGCEFITFGDIQAAVRTSIKNRCVETARALANYYGLWFHEDADGITEHWLKQNHTHECFAGSVPDEVFKDMEFWS